MTAVYRTRLLSIWPIQLAALCLGAFVGGCSPQDHGDPSAATKALQEAKRLYEEAKEAAPEDVVGWARADIERGGDWEYRVAILRDLSPEDLESELNQFGKDRWEVFWVRDGADGLTVFLKRPARSYLRSIPIGEIGNAVSGAEK